MNELNKSQMNIFQRNAKVIVFLAIICGSTSGVLAKLITANSMAIGFYRLAFAFPFFAIPVLLYNRKELKALTKKDVLLCAIGGVFLFLHFFFWFSAAQTTTIASAVVLQSLHPLVVLLVTVFIFRQGVNIKAVLGILLAIIGGAAIAGFDYTLSGDSFAGDIYALLAGTFYGLYFCIGNLARKKISAGVYIFLVFLFCGISFTFGMIASDTPFTGYPVMDYVWLVLMTLLCQIGAHAVFNWSLGYVSSLYLSTVGTSEIIISTILALLIFTEIPTLWQCFGAALVIVGLICYNYNER